MKKLKIFRKFNIIDFLAVTLLLVALIVSGYYFTRDDGLFTKHQFEIEYTIKIDKIENEFIGNLSDGDELYDFSTTFPIGKVSEIRTAVVDKQYSEMEVVVKADAEVHGGVFSVSGVDIFTGKWIEFRTPSLVHGGNCIAVMVNNKTESEK